MAIAPDIARDFEKQLSKMDPQIRVKEKWVIDKLLRKKRNLRIRKRQYHFSEKCHIDNRNVFLTRYSQIDIFKFTSHSNLAQCLSIDPFYYEYQV